MCFSKIFLSETADFESPYPIEETRSRLCSAFAHDNIGDRFKTTREVTCFIMMYGDQFHLTCYHPGKRNDFKPVFYGKLNVYGPCSKITGKFRLKNATIIFLILWIPLASAATLLAIKDILVKHTPVVTVIPILLILLFGIFLTRLGWKAGQNDITIISDAIRKSMAS